MRLWAATNLMWWEDQFKLIFRGVARQWPWQRIEPDSNQSRSIDSRSSVQYDFLQSCTVHTITALGLFDLEPNMVAVVLYRTINEKTQGILATLTGHLYRRGSEQSYGWTLNGLSEQCANQQLSGRSQKQSAQRRELEPKSTSAAEPLLQMNGGKIAWIPRGIMALKPSNLNYTWCAPETHRKDLNNKNSRARSAPRVFGF